MLWGAIGAPGVRRPKSGIFVLAAWFIERLPLEAPTGKQRRSNYNATRLPQLARSLGPYRVGLVSRNSSSTLYHYCPLLDRHEMCSWLAAGRSGCLNRWFLCVPLPFGEYRYHVSESLAMSM